MEKILQQYFSIYHILSLKGIGSFSLRMQPAKIDIAEKLIYPPGQEIIFKEDELHPSEHLIAFLKQRKRVDSETLAAYENSLSQKLQNGESISLPGIGTLARKDGHLNFIPFVLNDLFEPVAAERVIRKNVEHAVTVGEQLTTSVRMQETLMVKEQREDKWWIGALILGLIGLAAIAFYYLRK